MVKRYLRALNDLIVESVSGYKLDIVMERFVEFSIDINIAVKWSDLLVKTLRDNFMIIETTVCVATDLLKR